MLLTRSEWADPNPGKSLLFAPHRPWRCVGLTAESPLFLVDLFWGETNDDQAIRSVLVVSPEELITVVQQFGVGSCRVFRLGLTNGDRNSTSALEKVLAVRSYRRPDSHQKWYVYVDTRGRQCPCHSWMPEPDVTSIWEDELRLELCIA